MSKFTRALTVVGAASLLSIGLSAYVSPAVATEIVPVNPLLTYAEKQIVYTKAETAPIDATAVRIVYINGAYPVSDNCEYRRTHGDANACKNWTQTGTRMTYLTPQVPQSCSWTWEGVPATSNASKRQYQKTVTTYGSGYYVARTFYSNGTYTEGPSVNYLNLVLSVRDTVENWSCSGTYIRNCSTVSSPITPSNPAYRRYLDRDGDGIACE